MRIGIDYRPALDVRGGIGVYVQELAAALRAHAPEDELELFGHRLRGPAETTRTAVPEGATLHRRRVPAPVLDLAGKVGFGADRLLGDVDVLHATDYVPITSTRAPLVATIHDVCFHTLPACYEPALRERLARVTDDLVARAARVIVPCARVRDELLAHTGASADQVRVVPHGPPALVLAGDATALEEPGYVLCVATVQPRKNIDGLLDAFALLREQHTGARLVVAGAAGWDSGALEARLGVQAGVTWYADVDREAIGTLYAGAAAVAYPSFGEGFGFPVLEAWHAGAPLLVGADTASADLAGSGALAVDPHDAQALAAGLRTLLDGGADVARMIEEGRARLAGFSWARTAAATRAVYAEAIAS